MIKCFPIDFIRQALEQTMLKEHITNENFYGGKDQVSILSFYEHLKTQEQVDRFVKTYRDLSDQQNRTGLIMNGILVAPENPTITNLYSSLIIPMAFTCSFRITLGDRDNGIITINNLIEQLKGRKVDIAQLNCVDEDGKPCNVPFVVGTIGENDGAPAFENGDYIGTLANANAAGGRIAEYILKGIIFNSSKDYWFYCQHNNELKVIYYDHSNNEYSFIVEDGNHPDIIFPPTHTSFEKYKLSLSFDAIRCDEPRTLNSSEYCELSFGGSATLVSQGVALGNDLLKLSVKRTLIKANNNIVYNNQVEQYLEPLEMPSGSNANTQISQLVSNNFKTNSHTDGLGLTLQYSFIVDFNIDLIKKWFDYARYGNIVNGSDNKPLVSPNIIYQVKEIWSSWGNYESKQYLGKIVENIEIENTESDVLTIGITMQIQGDN